MAEISFGLRCGCFPTISRLYQQLASSTPNNNDKYNNMAIAPKPVRLGGLRRDCIPLDGQSKPSLPDRADGEGRVGSGSRNGSSGDEQVLEIAVEGKEAGGDGDDLGLPVGGMDGEGLVVHVWVGSGDSGFACLSFRGS